MPFASVSLVPAPSRSTVLAPTASALVTVRAAGAAISSVPAEPRKVTVAALLVPSSFRVSPETLPIRQQSRRW